MPVALKVAFIQKVLKCLSYLQTDEPNYFPELIFLYFVNLKGSNSVTHGSILQIDSICTPCTLRSAGPGRKKCYLDMFCALVKIFKHKSDEMG